MSCPEGPQAAAGARLLADVENHLNITWQDEATDRKIRNLVQSGIAYLNGKLGEAGDYLSPGQPRTLLFEYVRYARDEALDVFENNYQSLILSMQHERQVAAFQAAATAEAQS